MSTLKRIVLDIETDSLDATRIWCICVVELDTDEVRTYGPDERDFEQFKLDTREVDLVVTHNGIAFDLPVLRRLLSWECTCTVRDTLVLSHLLKYEVEDGHSLEAWGKRLGLPKLEHTDFSKYTPDMLTYCINDTKVSKKLYLYLEERLSKLKVFDKAIDVEHTVQEILQRDVKEGGYPYDKAKADYLRSRVMDRVSKLDELILVSFPPVPVSLGDYVPRLTKHGTIARTNLRWWRGNDFSVFTDGAPFTRLGWELFNPGSVKQIVQRLTDNGWWEPTERTDGYLEAQRTGNREKLNRLEKYAWKLNETNLATLTDKAPEGAKLLVERLALNSRLTMLDTWEKNCQTTIELRSIDVSGLEQSALTILNGEHESKSTIVSDTKRSGSARGTKISWALDTTIRRSVNADTTYELPTDSVLKTLIKCLKSSKVYVHCVEKTVSSLLITVTPLVLSEGYSANPVTLVLDGLKAARLECSTISTSIRGTINGIGTWTHRCSHNNPNLANIATAKTIKYKNPDLARSVIQLGAATRSLFHAKGHWQVGVDADGIQLRLFAHYANDQALIEANVNGNKELGTDVHSLNKRALGSVCLTRDDAKTWIYAYLLGAGDAKLARILKCDPRQAKQAKENLLKTYRSINKLRKEVIPRDAARGYFQGLDGRYVCCSSEHLMLSGYLQNGEKLIMAYALREAKRRFEQEQLNARLLTWVHDEFQWQVKGKLEDAHRVGQITSECITWAGEHLECKCPQKGNYIVGRNWYDCH